MSRFTAWVFLCCFLLLAGVCRADFVDYWPDDVRIQDGLVAAVFDLAAKDQNIHESQTDIAFCNYYMWSDVPPWVIKFIRTQDELGAG